ncbi:hypothetical protein J4461_02480 [Candidatus Pacearchaeota archaeon]|nr:hypothetical protein [Candidatus Pacearchaeota archaeon]
MTEEYAETSAPDPLTKIRDVEEKQRILKDRVLLIGKTLVDEKEKTFKDIQDIKKILFTLKEEQDRIKEIIQNLVEQSSQAARKEELMMLQRQFDLFRKA